jgi:hypothetical protein
VEVVASVSVVWGGGTLAATVFGGASSSRGASYALALKATCWVTPGKPGGLMTNSPSRPPFDLKLFACVSNTIFWIKLQ